MRALKLYNMGKAKYNVSGGVGGIENNSSVQPELVEPKSTELQPNSQSTTGDVLPNVTTQPQTTHKDETLSSQSSELQNQGGYTAVPSHDPQDKKDEDSMDLDQDNN